jgi:hypothetical protein
MPSLCGRADQLVPGMRVFAEIDSEHTTDVCTVVDVSSEPVRNIRVMTSGGGIRMLCIWQVRSTLPSSEADVVAWADA